MAKRRLPLFLACACLLLICSMSIYVALDRLAASEAISDKDVPNSDQTENGEEHEDPGDYVWDTSDVVNIVLNGNSIAVNSSVAAVEGSKVTISSAGTYGISGTLNDGQIVVDTDDEGVVRLILGGVNISCATKAPVFVASAEKTVVVLADNTENHLRDSENNEDDGALLSKDDLTIYGNGSLAVSGNANDAIRSNDGLIIEGGTITVTSIDDGIRGKDYLVIKSGDITVNSVGDGLKSDNDEDEDKGYIRIESGTINTTSTEGDAIVAQTDLSILGGIITLTSGGGSHTTLDEDVSTKGLKAGASIVIERAELVISSSDDSIHSNGTILMNNGTYNIASGDDGIRGDTSLEINGGELHISQSYEGIESAAITIKDSYIQIYSSDDGLGAAGNSTGDAADGRILVEKSVLNITSGGDAIQADVDVILTSGEIILTSGGGSSNRIDASTSAKGIKAGVNVIVDDGTIMANSADDAIHSNGNITINGGRFVISTGDDAVHADLSLEINGGDINITKSFEGLESATITINGGDIHIVSSDDGINVVGGTDVPGTQPGPGQGGLPGQGGGPGQGGVPGQDPFGYSSDYYLHVNGGYVYIDALGDGIDVGGVVEMTAGYLIIDGPIANDNGALDFGTFKITGGLLLAVGSSGMAQVPGNNSTQCSVMLNLRSPIQAGVLVHIQTNGGTEVFTFEPTKQCQSIVISSTALALGSTYDVYFGGSSTGTVKDGLYLSGTYTPGTKYGSFTITGIVTTKNNW